MPVLLDTGVLLAAADRRDRRHGAARALFRETRESFLLPTSVVPEVCYLLRKALGIEAEREFLRNVAAGRFPLVYLTTIDVARAEELIGQYRDVRLDFVDASIMALAERLGVTKVATTDRRDFSLVRPAHCECFELLP